MIAVPALLLYALLGVMAVVTLLVAAALIFCIVILRNIAQLSDIALEEARDLQSGISYVKELFGISLPL